MDTKLPPVAVPVGTGHDFKPPPPPVGPPSPIITPEELAKHVQNDVDYLAYLNKSK